MNDKDKTIRDKSVFDNKYDYWLNKPLKNTYKMNKPKMDCLEEIIKYHKNIIPYDIISDEKSIWRNLFHKNDNKYNFLYVIFMSVHERYLKRKPDYLEPDVDEIEKWHKKRMSCRRKHLT
jgi:hypothetical protein